MTALRERMTQDLILRGLSLNTQAAYLRAVSQLARYYRRSPERISEREVAACPPHLYQPASLVFHGARCRPGYPPLFFLQSTVRVPAITPQRRDRLVDLRA